MPDVTSLRETGTISLREALRCVVRGYGDVGQRTAKRWDTVSFVELTHDDKKILDTGARTLFRWLQEGKLDALHRSDIRYLASKIAQSDWLCCKFDEVNWHLSAIRTQPHTQMIENIQIISKNFNCLISKHASDNEEDDQNRFFVSAISPRSRKQQAVQQIVKELKEKGTHIAKETPNVKAIELIQNYAQAKRDVGDMAIEVPTSDTILRALGRKK